MRGDAIKHAAATVAAGIEPTDQETTDSLCEAVDIVLAAFVLAAFVDLGRIADSVTSLSETLDGDVARIADAATTLAGCVDDNCQPALVVTALVSSGALPDLGE